eukprot:PhM_4_TR13188/c0_g1_i1/m.81831
MPIKEPSAEERVEEEISCIRSMTQCLLSSHSASTDISRSPSGIVNTVELRELLDVLASLVECTRNPYRTHILLFEVSPSPIQVLFRYITTNPSLVRTDEKKELDPSTFEVVQTACVQTLSRIVVVCTESYNDVEPAYLIEPLWRELSDHNALDVMLRFLSTTTAATSVCISCSECLFLLCTKIPSIVHHVSEELGAASYLLDVMMDRRKEHLLRNYTATVVRLIFNRCPAEQQTDFANVAFLQTAVKALACEDESEYVATLLIEMVTKLLQRMPGLYGELRLLPDAVRALTTCFGLLCASPEGGVVTAACTLFQLVFSLESSFCVLPSSNQHTDVAAVDELYAQILRTSAWKALIVKDGANRAIQLATMRIFVQFSVTTDSTEALVKCISDCSVTLRTMLALPQISGDDDVTKAVKLESAVIVLLLMCKHPNARVAIRDTLAPHPAWRDALKATIERLLSSVHLDYYTDVPIVDVNGTHLNNVSYAQQYVHDWASWAEVIAVVHTMFQKQETTFAYNHGLSVPSEDYLATEWPVRALPNASHHHNHPPTSTVPQDERPKRLTYAILHAALRCLGPSHHVDGATTLSSASTSKTAEVASSRPQAPQQQKHTQMDRGHHRATSPSSSSLHQQGTQSVASSNGVLPHTPRGRPAKAAAWRKVTDPPSYPRGMAALVRPADGPPRGTLAASKLALRPPSVSSREALSSNSRRSSISHARGGVPFYTQRLHSPPPASRDEALGMDPPPRPRVWR